MPRLLFTLLFIGIILLWSSPRPWHYMVNDESGLPSNEVYQVLQDDFGYLWIGCDEGLFRYDGRDYVQYTCTAQNGRSISRLQLDVDGDVWCKNFNGQVFRVDADSLRLICDLTGRVATVFPYCLGEARDVFVGTHENIIRYSPAGDSLSSVTVDPLDSIDNLLPIQDMLWFENSIYCFAPGAGICRWEPESGVFTVLKGTHARTASGISFHVYRNELWFLHMVNTPRAYSLGVIRNDSAVITHAYEARENAFRVHTVCTDHADGLWLCTSEGAYSYNENVSRFSPSQALFSTEKISWVLQDREDQFWFASLNSGMFVCPSPEVKTITPENSTLGEKQVTAIAALPTGEIVAGSYDGSLYRIFTAGDSAGRYNEQAGEHIYFPVKSFCVENNLFFVSRGAVQMMESPGGPFISSPLAHARDMAVANDTVFYILPEAFAKVALADLRSRGEKAPVTFIRRTGGRSIEYSRADEQLYIAFNDGVYSYASGKLAPVQHNGQPIYANSLSSSGSTTWVAGVNSGIIGIKKGVVSVNYSSGNGLKENNVRHIYAANDTVLASTNQSLYLLATGRNPEIISFDITEGINAKDIAGITLLHGEIWLATNKGVQHFPADLPSVNTLAPPIRIASVTHNGKEIGPVSECALPFENHELKISFTSVALRSHGAATFEYRLLGLDSQWVSLPWINNAVTYPTLPPGEYKFEVRAVNECGFTSEEPARLSITVEHPVWQTWWFYLFASVIVIGLVLLIAAYRLKAIRRRADMLQKLTMSQLTALKAQMNPHFMYNALNSIQELVISQDGKNAIHYLGRFSKLMRKVLDASGKDRITLGDEIEILHLYLELEQLRMGADFHYSISKEEHVDDEISIPSMIIQPYVENALKHGLLHRKGRKELSVHFAAEGSVLVCTVKDNGIGREKAAEIRKRQEHVSFATAANEKRIELLNAFTGTACSISISDLKEGDIARGTLVVVRIPFS